MDSESDNSDDEYIHSDNDLDHFDNESNNISPVGTYIIIAILAVSIFLIIGLLLVGLSVYLNNTIDQRPRMTARSRSLKTVSNKNVVIPQHSIDGIAGMSYNQYKHVGNGMGILECGADGRSELRDGKCVCTGYYWGINCDLESYNPAFNAIGNLPDDWCGTYPSEFRQCHNDCLIDGDCAGFEWRDGYCTLLDQTPTFSIDQAPTYNPTVQPQLFLKESRPLFRDVIFLYYGKLPRRFWQGNRDNVIPVVAGTLYNIPFIPDNWINDSQLDLAMSDVPFNSVSQAKMIQRGNQPFIPTTYNWVMIDGCRNDRIHWWDTSMD